MLDTTIDATIYGFIISCISMVVGSLVFKDKITKIAKPSYSAQDLKGLMFTERSRSEHL
jgi:hypothetical protein